MMEISVSFQEWAKEEEEEEKAGWQAACNNEMMMMSLRNTDCAHNMFNQRERQSPINTNQNSIISLYSSFVCCIPQQQQTTFPSTMDDPVRVRRPVLAVAVFSHHHYLGFIAAEFGDSMCQMACRNDANKPLCDGEDDKNAAGRELRQRMRT